MKINFIVPGIYKSGGMRAIVEIAKGLSSLGNEVRLYYPSIPFNSFPGEYTWNSLRNYYWDLKTFSYNKNNLDYFVSNSAEICRVSSISDKFIEDADFVIATGWQTVNSVLNLRGSKGYKIYFIQDYENWRGNINAIDETYSKDLFGITTCKHLHDLIKQKFGIETEIIYYGVDLEIFKNPNKTIKKKKTVTFINHSAQKKNTEAALEIVNRIKRKFPQTHIKSFGIMPYNDLPSYIENYVNPSESKIVEILCNTDIFIYTSKVEGFGMPPSEAMACKAAVISSNVGAIPEYCRHGIDGFIFEPDDIDGFTSQIEKLLTNDDILLKTSLNGYERISSFLNWKEAVFKWNNLLHKLKSEYD